MVLGLGLMLRVTFMYARICQPQLLINTSNPIFSSIEWPGIPFEIL